MVELLSSIAGVVLSLALAYIPGISTWYNALTGDQKRGLMALLLLMVAGGLVGAACAGYYDGVTCDQAGAAAVVRAYIAALVANQATYSLAVQGRQS